MSLQSAFSARLAADADAAALCRLAIDFLLDRPVSTYLTPARVELWLEHAYDEGTVADAIDAHARGFVERERARARKRGDRIADWISPEAQAELRSLAARPVVMKRETLERWVDQDAVRGILRSIVQETLERFIDTVRPGGTGGGLLGQVGRGALGFASRAGRGLLGGLGNQLEDALRAAVQTFVSGSMGLMVDRFVGILMRPETQRQMGRVRLRLYEQVMKADSADIFDAAHEEPALEDLLDALPGLIAHNLDRPEVREIVRDEAMRWIEVEGTRPVRSFLAEEKIAILRDDLITIAGPLVQAFAASAAFGAWADGAKDDGEEADGEGDEEDVEPGA